MSGKRTCTGENCNCSTRPTKRSRPNNEPTINSGIRNTNRETLDDATEALTNGNRGKPDDRLVGLMGPMLEILQCPLCLDLVEPTCKMCASGHLVCATCFLSSDGSLKHCPICRAKLTVDSPACIKNVLELLHINKIPEMMENSK